MNEPYVIRPIEPEDTEALRRLFSRLSAETVYRRFFRPVRELSASVLEFLCSVDHSHRDALVAEVAGEVIAVARYDRLGDTDEAELAVVVEDAWQGHGLGRRLVTSLAVLAESRGMHVFTATILGDNRAASGLVRAMSNDADMHFESGELIVRAPIHAQQHPAA
jgi:RimJ/RimL family protein N-acetyltransferase